MPLPAHAETVPQHADTAKQFASFYSTQSPEQDNMVTQQAAPETKQRDAKKAGRPRSDDSTRAILESVRRLLTHMPVSKLSIEAIARKAGVGKTTIYRWWPNKQAVLMDAVFSQGTFNNILPQSGEPIDLIDAQVEKMVRQLSGKNGRIVAEIIGEVQGDPGALRSLIDTFFQDRYNTLGSALSAGVQSGAFRRDLDLETAIDAIMGPIIFRILSGQDFDGNFHRNLMMMVNGALRA